MQIVITDQRKLGVVVQRSDAHYWNPTTTGWETPFSATSHVIPFAVVDAAAPLFATVQAAQLGAALMQVQNCAALIVTLDSKGNPLAVVDVWTLPTPSPTPLVGGWVRA